MSNAELEELAQKLGVPGGQKLYTAARKRGLAVTKKQVQDFVRKQGQKQIFRPLPPAAGKTASESEQMRAQMDLVDLSTSPSKGNSFILVVLNVWNRMGFAIPVEDKRAKSVATGLSILLDDPKLAPEIISTDSGNEWKGAVEALLQERQIVHRTKDPSDVNALAAVDRFIQTLKKRLAENLASEKGEWADRVAEVVRQYNESPHETLFDEAPVDLAESKVASFMNLQENARKLRHNQKLFETRKRAVETAGAFRRPLPGLTKFKRGFRATWDKMETVEGFDGSLVETGGARAVDVKRVLPVDAQTRDVEPGFALGQGRVASKRQRIQTLALEALNFVSNEEEVSVQRLAAHLKEVLGNTEYRLQLMGIGAQNLSDAIRLIPELSLARNGNYVRRKAPA
jgi:hypothetical protein